jgi:hypothetical protein
MDHDKIICIIGYIDSYGAIHKKDIKMDGKSKFNHDDNFPMQTHKRWRFWIKKWELESSPSSIDINDEDKVLIMDYINNHYKVPKWVLRKNNFKKYKEFLKIKS